MTNVPRSLYTKEITSFINDLVEYQDAKCFYSIDDIHQDKLVALGIKALDCDIDIVIGHDANKHLAEFLLSSDPDDRIELIHAMKDSAREKFSSYFDIMISDKRDEIRRDTLWQKSA